MKTKILFLAAVIAISFHLISFNCAAQAPCFAWAKGIVGSGADGGRSIGIDTSGNSYVTGWFDGTTITFGTNTLTNNRPGFIDIFIAKYDGTGNVVWAKNTGGSGGGIGYGISVDASGNSYITGSFGSPTITFGTTTLTNNGNGDIFIAKYDNMGNVIWAKSAGGNNDDEAYSISVDAIGNSYITGYFSSPTIIFGTTTLTNNGTSNIFIAKYDNLGNVIWANSAGGSDADEEGYSISADASGNSYITGSFESPTIIFGTTTLNNNGSSNIFIVKYDNTGNVIWAKSIGGSSIDGGYSICVDTSENSYLTGFFDSPTITFGTTTLTNNGSGNIFITKYDGAGNVVWAKSAGGSGGDVGISISVDASGNSYITGTFDSPTISIGTTTLTNAAATTDDIFIAKYDEMGNALWAKSAGGSFNDLGSSIIMDASGNSYITGGSASPTISFGTTTLTNNTTGDTANFFIAKLGASVGIQELNNSFNTSVYPNPANDNLTIDVSTTLNKPATIEISNIQGQLIETLATTGNKTNIDVSAFAKGMYFVKVRTEKGVESRKFVKE